MTIETTKQALEKWHQMIKTGDMSSLNELLADDVVFRSPVAYKPYEGKHVVFFIRIAVKPRGLARGYKAAIR